MAGQNTQARPARPTPKTAEETASAQSGVVFLLIEFFVLLAKTLIVSLFVSIGVALVGVTWFWPEQGVNHELTTLNLELSELAFELRSVGAGFSYWVSNITAQLMEATWLGGYIRSAVTWVGGLFSDQAVMYGEVAYYATMVFVVRLGVILSSLPILVIWMLLGFFCGLTERDLRRFNAALESSTIFNLAMRNAKIPFFICIAAYLSWPTRAYAVIATLPVCIGTFVMVYLAVAHYKKRL
ncbi:DUF4400 domain-containing protein [Vibrio vulnificus]